MLGYGELISIQKEDRASRQLKDIESISHIGQEAVIVDCYQRPAPTYLEQLKQVSSFYKIHSVGCELSRPQLSAVIALISLNVWKLHLSKIPI